MAAHALAARFAGASLLALIAASAQAQDHAHHPQPTPPASQPPAHQHHPTPAQAAADPHAGHDMSTPGMTGHAMAMSGALGPWDMSREASGTAWQPDASVHGGVHGTAGEGRWTTMTHALLNLAYTDQNGPRGDDKAFLAGMLMSSARRTFDDGGKVTVRAMFSPDPFMGKDGYPLLLAAGETADGVNPLIDRQHPHELIMELSASYSRPVGQDGAVFGYIGWPGEPAFGPPAFMHRMSAMDSPEAPITHHWLDSTHITFGVATVGFANRWAKIEGSAFRGREPDQDRYDMESPSLDSWSVRASLNPSPEWSLQASYADVASAEQLDPGEDETKLSLSAIHTRRLGRAGWWATTAAWGRKTNDHDESKDAWLLESAVHPDDRWTVFARAERIETDELIPAIGGGHGDLYTVAKATVGAIHDWRLASNVRLGLGAVYSVNRVPDALEPVYGGDPDGTTVFLRLKID